MSVEKLHIKLKISSTYWDRKPQHRIMINDTLIREGVTEAASGEIETIEFDSESDAEKVTLKIQLFGKEESDTVENEDKTEILNDMMLNIHGIEIDEIDLRQTPYLKCKYYTDEVVTFAGEKTQEVTECTNLGWNGTWTLTWTRPFYLWLLDVM